jgi:hypothetical protein
MHKLAFRPQEYPVEKDSGGLGTRIFNKSYAEHKTPTDIGLMGLTIMETLTFIEHV